MKCTIPEISWHNREPVLSVDLHPVETNFYRLASGGSDTLILIWQLRVVDNGSVTVEILSEMTRHQKAVNVVKWSPNGAYLASGDDDANIILWQLKTDNVPLLEGDNNFKETWIIYKVLRGHKEDIYDLSWSPDSSKLLSGSVDNTAMIWDVAKAQSQNIIRDHKSFVQGVAFDPKNEFFSTLSSDRHCRVFDTKKCHVKARIAKGVLPVLDDHALFQKEVKFFHDDTFKTFFRRLSFSPDGSILVVPSGSVETEDSKNVLFATYIFTLDQLNQPAAMFPIPDQCSIVAKCCPILFELRPEGPKPFIDLPYRIVIAVATDRDVIIYDTQQLTPFAHLQNVHYTRLTDLSWSSDGLLLVASSTDGFITLVTFEVDEIGIRYIKEESEAEESILNISGIEEIQEEVVEEKPKKSSFLEKWAKQGCKKRRVEDELNANNGVKKIKCDDEPVVIEDSPVKVGSVAGNGKVSDITGNDKVMNVAGNDKVSNVGNDTAGNVSGNDKVGNDKVGNVTENDKVCNVENIKVENVEGNNKVSNVAGNMKIDNVEGNVIVDNDHVDEVENVKAVAARKRIKPTFIAPIVKNDVAAETDAGKTVHNTVKIVNDLASKDIIEKDIQNKANNDIVVTNNVNKNAKIPAEKNKTPKQMLETKTPKSKGSDTKKPRGKPKDKQVATPKMSLLQFFKPLSKAEKVEKSNNVVVKDESMDLTETEAPTKIKINTSSLFKPKTPVVNLTEDSCEVPDDFELRIDDDDEDSKVGNNDLNKNVGNSLISINENDASLKNDTSDDLKSQDETSNSVMIVDDVKVETEKENKLEIIDKNVDALKSEGKQPRRIPLITLSSPKNKKKRNDA